MKRARSGAKRAASTGARTDAARAAGMVRDIALYDGLFERWMGRLEADLPMIFEIAVQADGPILELGVGAGRVALPLARRGHDVTGVDDAPAMIEAARRRLAAEPLAVRRRVRLVRRDVRKLALPRRHRLALLAFNTFMHFESLADQDLVLAGAARAVVRGGWLWMSLFNPETTRPAGVVRAEPEALAGEAPGLPGSRTEAFFQQSFDRATQITRVRFWLDTVATDGLVRREALELRLRWFHRFELERLLAAHGFEVVQLFGDFDGSDYVDGSPQLIALARRV